MDKMNHRLLSVLSATALLAGTAVSSAQDFSAGLDVRARYDSTHELPNDKRGQSADSDYERLRTRVWGKYQDQDNGLTLFIRLANEFRNYHHPSANSSKQRFPDVLFIDNLYVQYDNLLGGGLGLKLGRQDMSFGRKRIISDGTGGDGSRSSCFDALRLTWRPAASQSLDAFAIYVHNNDLLPTLGKEHANHKRPSDYDVTGYGQNEYDAGLYWQDRTAGHSAGMRTMCSRASIAARAQSTTRRARMSRPTPPASAFCRNSANICAAKWRPRCRWAATAWPPRWHMAD